MDGQDDPKDGRPASRPPPTELLFAKRLAEYTTLTGVRVGDELIDAIQPFESLTKDYTSRDLAALRKAVAKACRHVDRSTLVDVLDGRSPLRFDTGDRPGQLMRSSIKRVSASGWLAIFLGLLSLYLVVYFTQWEARAGKTIARLDEYFAFDYDGQVWHLAERISAIADDAAMNQPIPNVRSALVQNYLSTITHFRKFYSEQAMIYDEVGRLLVAPSFPAWPGHVTGWFRRFLDDEATGGPADADRSGAGSDLAEVEGRLDALSDEIAHVRAMLARDGSQPTQVRSEADNALANQHLEAIESQITRMSTLLGRDPMQIDDYADVRTKFTSYRTMLEERVSIIRSFVFPILFGAVGALLYNVVRYLTSYLSSPTFVELSMRVAFAVFAAIAISMLFIPSGLFGDVSNSKPAFVYLLCFFFGYSVDTFIRVLGNFEAFVSRKLAPPDEKAQAESAERT
jgi:hypothetical protein